MKDEQKQISLLKFLEPALGLLLTVFSFFSTAKAEGLSKSTKIILYVIFSLVGVAVFYLIYRNLKAYINTDGNADTIGTAKLKKHIKRLHKLTRKNAKILKKNMKNNADYADKYSKKVLEFKDSSQTKNVDKNYLQNTTFTKKNYRTTIKDQKDENCLKYNRAFETCEVISNCIKDIDHILLSNGQYNDRVKLGKYLFKYHTNYFDRIKATVDMMGWTYSLMGKKDKSARAIRRGINELEELEKNYPTVNKDNAEIYFNIHLNLQRAYRHLAANPKIRRSHVFDESKKNLKKAEDALNKLISVSNKKIFTEDQLLQIERNDIGLKFGTVEINYDFAKRTIAKDPASDFGTAKLAVAIDELNKLLKIESRIKQLDQHRYLNVITIRNKIYFLANSLINNGCNNPSINNFVKDFKGKDGDGEKQINNALKSINGLLKKSIYVDQAIESYVQQRIIQTYKEVGEIYHLAYTDNLSKGE